MEDIMLGYKDNQNHSLGLLEKSRSCLLCNQTFMNRVNQYTTLI